jgi:hypothetical protein
MRIVVRFFLLLLLFRGPAHAGQFCNQQPPSPEALRQSLQLAFKTQEVLENSGATVALIGRVGVDLSAYGLRYSHSGIVWRDHPHGRWTVIHELNQCATDRSHLFDEGLGNFFLDSPFAYEALLVILSPDLQQKLVRTLVGPLPDQLHQPAYSMIANPWKIRYQNSNQWLLEVLAAAFAAPDEVHSRTDAQQWLLRNEYHPTTISLSAVQRLGARLFSANVQFDDHSLADRIAGRYQVVTVESVARFLHHREPQATQSVVRLDE